MTQENKEKLKNLLVYLDLLANSKSDLINTQGMMAMFQLQSENPDFADANKRHNIICELLNELDK